MIALAYYIAHYDIPRIRYCCCCCFFSLRQTEIVADRVYETAWNVREVFNSLEANMSLRELKVCLLGVRYVFTFYDLTLRVCAHFVLVSIVVLMLSSIGA